MASALVRLSHAIGQLPGRLLRSIVTEEPNFNAGRYRDLDEIEEERRRRTETWRRGVDEDGPTRSG
jgi:hypothetical protein